MIHQPKLEMKTWVIIPCLSFLPTGVCGRSVMGAGGARVSETDRVAVLMDLSAPRQQIIKQLTIKCDEC